MQANISLYNGTGQGAFWAQAQNWTYATIHLSSGRVSPGIPDEKLGPPRPVRAADPMARYKLLVTSRANTTPVDPLNVTIASLDLGAYWTRVQQSYAEFDLLALPVLSFVSEKLQRAYLFVPHIDPTSTTVLDTTMMVSIDLSTTAAKSTLLPRFFIPWDLYNWQYDQLHPHLPVFDQEHLCLLPNDPFSNRGSKVAFFNITSAKVVTQTFSYYFPFSSVLDFMVFDASGESRLNRLYEIHQNHSIQKENVEWFHLDNPDWGVMIPEGYEIWERSMTGKLTCRFVLSKEDLTNLVLIGSPSASPIPDSTTSRLLDLFFLLVVPWSA